MRKPQDLITPEIVFEEVKDRPLLDLFHVATLRGVNPREFQRALNADPDWHEQLENARSRATTDAAQRHLTRREKQADKGDPEANKMLDQLFLGNRLAARKRGIPLEDDGFGLPDPRKLALKGDTSIMRRRRDMDQEIIVEEIPD